LNYATHNINNALTNSYYYFLRQEENL